MTLREVPAPTPEPGHALLGLRLAGICGTDLEITRGYRGYRGILGHECVAQVLRCPEAPQWEGRRVVGEINLACGTCARCRGGLAKHCAARTVMGIVDHPGCFAEQLVLPIANLHPVPETIDDTRAVFTEPLAAAFEIFDSVPLDERSRVAVIGDGRLGLLVVLALRSRGIPVLAVGRHADKLARVDGPGVRTCLADDLPAGERFDVVVEATGSAQGLGFAIAHTEPRGTVVVKSTTHQPLPVDTTALVVNEIRLVGSRCGPFEVALQALAEGLVDPRPLVDARYPLAQGEAALAHASRRGTLKVLLEGPSGAG